MRSRRIHLFALLAVSSALAAPRTARAGCLPDTIVDDAYAGTLGSMLCCPYDFPISVPGTVDDVNVSMAVTHTWVGDLVIKLQSPAATVVTLQSRAGLVELADDGNGCCGDSTNWSSATIVYDGESNGPSSESMGIALDSTHNVCTDDGVCSYQPSSGAAAPGNLASFVGQSYAGVWNLCIGDAGPGDFGTWDAGDVLIRLNRRIPCTCAGKFRGGDRVIYAPIIGPAGSRAIDEVNLVATPEGGVAPPPGAKGEVMCGSFGSPPLLVQWDSYSGGHDGGGNCDCPTGGLVPLSTAGWFVNCGDVLPDLPWLDDFESGDTSHWSASVG